MVLYQESQDVVEPLNRVAETLGIDVRSVVEGSQESWTSFMLSLPAKGTICRLRMSGHEDLGFRWHIGDLNDMTALGTAAAYCDVVIAEKHWASILNRHAADVRARVSSNLADLPKLLLAD
jgi:hypothetical protein